MTRLAPSTPSSPAALRLGREKARSLRGLSWLPAADLAALREVEVAYARLTQPGALLEAWMRGFGGLS